MKKSKILIITILLLVVLGVVFAYLTKFSIKTELVSIQSKQELEHIYEDNSKEMPKNLFINIITMPFSFFGGMWQESYGMMNSPTLGLEVDTVQNETGTSSSIPAANSSSKDYSTTNIQVENVDEADITKTDGNYIYSLSNNNVIITNVMQPNDIKIAATIELADATPEDLIIYQDKLVVISTDIIASTAHYSYNSKSNTIVRIYDIQNKDNPTLIKDYKLFEPYYTSRCINNRLYVISFGKLRKENNDMITYYQEDNQEVKMNLQDIKYLKNKKTNQQTLISMIDLNQPREKVSVKSYLIDINNAYVSENNIYLLNYEYDYRKNYLAPPVSSLFGLKGAIGPFVYENKSKKETEYGTQIYKFNILEDGTIQYKQKTNIEGRTINQFSIDEYQGNLRVAVYGKNGSQVVVLNSKLEKIGETPYLAKGERMYSSRFLGDKAYLVTYRTMDPLYVIDVSEPTKPTVLGELKIPGYSTYLHPYDENHLIGIGMETEEVVNRNSSGKVISTTAKIKGMKMALFDVSNVNNPIQISSTIIGDSRATSAILTNHKALLFSKEKELIAIPVNNYKEDFEVNSSTTTYDALVRNYSNYNKSYLSEGYFVYRINLQDGFQLKGIVNHEKQRSGYSQNSKLLRGLYIGAHLYTISEEEIKVNKLENMELVSELKIRRGAYGE